MTAPMTAHGSTDDTTEVPVLSAYDINDII
jgi:hypothetical protein